MGQRRNAALMSSVAAKVWGGASLTMVATASKVPQSQRKSSMLISELTEGCVGSFRGYEKSCTRRNSSLVPALGTTPNGEDRKGPISCSNLDCENGPVYRPQEISFRI